MFDILKAYTPGTQTHAIAMLYTYGMYSSSDTNQLVSIVPRNYFHTVLIVQSEAELTDASTNYYIPSKGRMVLRKFKTSMNFKFDYILPNDVKAAVNKYITTNNNTWLVEKVRGGKYGERYENDDLDGTSGGGLGARIKTVMGYNIQTMRPAVENYEIHAKKMDPESVADAMGHSRIAQVNHYLQKNTYEDTSKYVGRRVSLPISAGQNKGKTITGVVGLNDGANPDFTPDKMPFSVVFDKKFKEPDEYISFPDKDIKFLDGPVPKQTPPKTNNRSNRANSEARNKQNKNKGKPPQGPPKNSKKNPQQPTNISKQNPQQPTNNSQQYPSRSNRRTRTPN